MHLPALFCVLPYLAAATFLHGVFPRVLNCMTQEFRIDSFIGLQVGVISQKNVPVSPHPTDHKAA